MLSSFLLSLGVMHSGEYVYDVTDTLRLYQRVETTERNVQSKKRKVSRSVIRQHSSVFVTRHGRHVDSECPKQRYFPPVLVTHFLYFRGVTSSV